MSSVPPAHKSRSLLSARRLVLLGSVAILSAGVLVGAGGFDPRSGLPGLSTIAYAQNQQRPAGFADIVDRVKPSVISVRVKVGGEPRVSGLEEEPRGERGNPMDRFERFFRRFGMPDGMPPDMQPGPRGPRNFSQGQGSGFFISADGYAVTNNHVVDKASAVEITTDDGKTYTAKVIGTDAKTDLALIKVEGRNDFPFVKLADNPPRVGDWVLAVGNPFGLGGTVTAGIVSARGRDIGAGPYDDFLQIDAPVNKGNSGGPTFDMDGSVIGVNTAIYSPSGGSIGIAFAIPAETVRTVIAQLREKGSVTRGWLGVQIQPVTPEIAESLGLKKPEGALVTEPQPGGPAAKAGIVSGDVIISVEDQPVKDARDLAKRIAALAPNGSVKVALVRKGVETTVSVKLADYPREQRQTRVNPEPREAPATEVAQLGLSLAPAPNRGEGVLVTEVDPSGPAADRFRTGDLILDVGGKAVSTPADVRKAVTDARAAGKRTVLMRVKSGQGTRFVAVSLERA